MPLWQPTKSLARPAYYDRDPVPVYGAVNATFAPHGVTQRASYTPPTDYAAFIEFIQYTHIRTAAAAPAASSNLYWDFLPFYGGTVRVLWSYFLDNTVNLVKTGQIDGYGYMAYGDTLQLFTQDASTGGTMSYQSSMKGTEFLY